jgi:hypothetical protein
VRWECLITEVLMRKPIRNYSPEKWGNAQVIKPEWQFLLRGILVCNDSLFGLRLPQPVPPVWVPEQWHRLTIILNFFSALLFIDKRERIAR